MDHSREHTFLMMHRHHNPRHKNNQPREWIVWKTLLLGRPYGRVDCTSRPWSGRTDQLILAFASSRANHRLDGVIETAANKWDFDEDSTKSSPHKHDCDGNVFEIFVRPKSAVVVTEMFHELLGCTIDKNHGGLDHFCCGSSVFPFLSGQRTWRLEIPSPSEISEDTAISSKRNDPVIEKDSA